MNVAALEDVAADDSDDRSLKDLETPEQGGRNGGHCHEHASWEDPAHQEEDLENKGI